MSGVNREPAGRVKPYRGVRGIGMKTAAVLLLAVLATGIPAGAGAAGLKGTVNGGGDDPRLSYPDPRLSYPDPRLQYSDPRLQYSDPRLQYADPRQPKPDPRQQPNVFPRSLPVVVITQPVYIAAPPSCVVPGYWAYAWVPQSYASSVFVPGYYNSDALWVDGHYESRTYTSGYYQPYWVPERAC